MQLKSIKATNFLSFRSLEYNFTDKPTLIQGENLTDDSQESNGSGKSALQAAIEYSLFKTTSKKVRDNDLIHFGEDESTLQLQIECPVRNQTLTISRKIKQKGSSTLEVSINDTIQTTATVNDGNDFILEWVGISKDDLQNYFIINKERYKSFFSSSNREKIEMINRFSNAQLIDGIDKEVQKEVQSLETELKTIESSKTSSISKIRTLKDQVDFELNRDLKTEIELAVSKIEGQISDKKDLINDRTESIEIIKESTPLSEQVIKDWNHKIEDKSTIILEIQKSLNKLNEINLSDRYILLNEKSDLILQNRTKTTEQKRKLVNDKREIESILDEIEKNIKGAVKCPKCSHEFLVGDPDVDIEEEKLAKVDTEKLVKKTQQSIEEILLTLTELDLQETEIDSKKSVIKKEEDQVATQKREIRRQIENIQTEITDFENEIKSIQKTIDSNNSNIERKKLEIKNLEFEIENLKEQIKTVKQKQIDQNRVDELWAQMSVEGKKLYKLNKDLKLKKLEIFNTSQWIFNFKKFNMYMANSSLKVIQGYCNKFLQDVRSDIQIRWEGIKMLADGKLKEEITPYCIRDNEQRDFWSYSGGERARLDYSMIFTLQEMINKTNKYGGLHFLSTDEIAEGVDSQGLSDLMKSLSKMNKTILITTHVVNKNIGDNVLLIKKVNGVSTIN